MKLFVTLLALALLASSTSGFGLRKLFRKPKKVEGGSFDIHINKYQHPITGEPVEHPVGQPVPVGQEPPFIGYGIPIAGPLPIPFDQPPFLSSIHNRFGQGRIRVAQIGFGAFKGGAVGQVPLGPYGGPLRGQVSVPVFSQQSLQVVPVRVPGPFISRPQIVSVEPSVQAVQLLFNSASSPLIVRQQHFGAQGSLYQATRSEDNPHILRHEVLKPVVQDVREIIQPYRTVTQEIKPVLERVHTIVPRRQYDGQVVKGFQEKAEFASDLQGPQQEFVQQQRIHFENEVPQEFHHKQITQEQIQQVPIEQEQIEQAPIKGHI